MQELLVIEIETLYEWQKIPLRPPLYLFQSPPRAGYESKDNSYGKAPLSSVNWSKETGKPLF